jgi:alpha-D-xyloside xylohydrolase
MMRALAFDFRTDPRALEVTDQYLFGPAFLIAPVLEPHARSRRVYLPGNDTWFDFWNGRAWKGGQQIESNVEIATIPVFVRAGSIVPLGPVRAYADAPSEEPLELRVYPGRDGSFTLFDDAGDGYGYLRGERSTVTINWTDHSQRLRINARQGTYPGMPATLTIAVVCAATPGLKTPLVRYDGRAQEVVLRSCRVPTRAAAMRAQSFSVQ